MFPISVMRGSDPFRLGCRAVDIALRNDQQRIVALAHRYRERAETVRRRWDRYGLAGMFAAVVCGALGVSGGPMAVVPMAFATVAVMVGVICSSRGALLRERIRDIEAVLSLAFRIRDVLDARDDAASEPL